MKWASLLINILASGFITGYGTKQAGSPTNAAIAAGVAAAASNAAGLFQKQPHKNE